MKNISNKNSPTIFGYSFEAISRAQQGNALTTERLSGTVVKPIATSADIEALKTHGLDWLTDNQKFGTLDRLKTAGLI